jgi:hypothetical protein
MLGRIAAAAALIALAGCAGMESAGRNASRSPAPDRVASAPPPAATPAPAATIATPPPPASSTPPPATMATTPAPRVVASTPAAPPPAAAPPARIITPAQSTAAPPIDDEEEVQTASRSGDDVVVPGVRERQVPAPGGDPRSNAERMQDIRAWDQCVMRVQGAAEADPMRPQLVTPEDYCSQSLGMAERTSVPQSRLERRQR